MDATLSPRLETLIRIARAAGIVPSAINPVMNFLRSILRLPFFGLSCAKTPETNHMPNRRESLRRLGLFYREIETRIWTQDERTAQK